MEGNLRRIPKSEFLRNNGENCNDLWVLVHGKVINMKGFKHPGGLQTLMDDHDLDRGEEYDSIHSPAAISEMKSRIIGVIDDEEKSDNDVKTHKKTDSDKLQPQTENNNLWILLLVICAIVTLVYLLNFKKYY
jgi:cytochrome b involved in lipid metabolism